MLLMRCKVLSNGFVSNEHLRTVSVYRYILKNEVEPKSIYGILNALCSKFSRMGISAAIRGNSVFTVRGSVALPENIELGGMKFERDVRETTLSSENDGKLITNIVRQSFLRAAEKEGYSGRKGSKLHLETPRRKRYIDVYDGFQYEIEVLKDGRVTVWIDPANVWRLPVMRYVNALKEDGFKQDEISTKLKGVKVSVPSVKRLDTNTATVESAKFVTIRDYKIPDLNVSLYDYWKGQDCTHYLRRKNITLAPSDSPVLEVKYKGINSKISFPAKVCELHIDLEDTELTADIHKKLSLGTELDHALECRRIASRVLGKGIIVGDSRLSFRNDLLDWEKSDFGTELSLTVPTFIFGNEQRYASNGQSEPYLMEALRKFGPVTRKDTINVIVFAPEYLKGNTEELISYLNDVGKRLNLADLKVIQKLYLETGDPDEYRVKAQLLEETEDIDAAIVVLNDKNEQGIYLEAKKGLGEIFLKSQMIRASTVKSLVDRNNSGRFFTASIIAAQLYGKVLEAGESIWHLASGAGGLDPMKQTYFMGFDVSRNVELKREAGAYSAICDPFGRVLTRKKVPFKGEKVSSVDLSEWFFEAAISAFKSSNGTNKLDNLILFKDGDIKENQVIEYEQGCDIAMKRMVKSGLMEEDGNIVVVATIKSGPYRLFGSEEDEYKLKNKAVIRGPNEAIIVTFGNDPSSKKRTLRGTPQPIRLKIVHQMKREISIEQLCQIFNDLRYLDYSSLLKQPKTILPLHIVQNLAKLIKEGISVPYDPR